MWPSSSAINILAAFEFEGMEAQGRLAMLPIKYPAPIAFDAWSLLLDFK
jgi:hypothetical protein